VRRVAAAAADAVASVAAATGAVALLQHTAPVAGLATVYLLAVLFVAFRDGEIAALATAVLAVLTLNFFFIEPRHRLTIADSREVVALAVLLIAGVVVSRLAAAARQRERESEQRARVAAAREREASLLAAVASSLLSEGGPGAAFASSSAGRLLAVEEFGLRLELAPVPACRPGEQARGLPLRRGSAWLYARSEGPWSRADLDRIADPLARLLDVAFEREEVRRRTAEADAVRRADVAKTAVLHAISHDLRSPLTSITTATTALRAGTLSDADRAELLSVLSDEAARLSRLVDDLLDLSRIEAGAVDPQLDWCDLRDAVTSAAGHVRAQHGDPRFEFVLDADLPLVRADPVQIERVFSNLLDNAVKFSPAASAVRVAATHAGDRVTVRITDRGRGIPQHARAKIFDPFFRGAGNRGGSGLGLAICRGFAEANGAQIRVHSRKGDGTSFTVSFPLVPQPVTVG
jgi:two-component system, OmpR family, sensor histidine kinase KdpD